MTDEFTGLVAETSAERRIWRDQQIQLPPMAGEVKEQLFDKPPSWLRLEDQSATNTCAAHGGSTCQEGIYYAKTGEVMQFSRNYIYARGQQQCGLFGRDVGCTLGGIVSALKKYGAPPESMWPFSGTYQTQIPRGCDEAAAANKVTHTIDIESLGYDGYRSVLGQNIGKVLMATSWPVRTWNGNVVERYQPLGRGGHAMAAMWLSTRRDNRGRPYVIVINSHANLPVMLWSPDALDELTRASEWGVTGLTDMSTPAPREVDWKGKDNPFAK